MKHSDIERVMPGSSPACVYPTHSHVRQIPEVVAVCSTRKHARQKRVIENISEIFTASGCTWCFLKAMCYLNSSVHRNTFTSQALCVAYFSDLP